MPNKTKRFTPFLSILPFETGNVTTWHFCLSYSHSTPNGHNGTNACSFVSLMLCKLHLAAPELPHPNHPLSSTCVFRMVQGIGIGNKFYGRYRGGNVGMSGVREAAQKV